METRSVDRAIQDLGQHKDTWARLPVARKVHYLQGIMDAYAAIAPAQVAAANRAKGISADAPAAGEEWVHPYLTIRLVRLLRDSLRQITISGRPQLPRGSVRTRSDGRVTVQVFPLSFLDRLLYHGCRSEIWMQAGVTMENLADNMASFYRQERPSGKVALVLGAGNVASLGPGDILHKLFVEGQVCLFKHNPVNAYLGPFLEDAFRALIRDGFLRTAYGGPEVGEYLCRHPDIEEIHLTGSDRTYEAIVFGSDEEGKQRKLANQPRIEKRITCELGNVSPVIVVPGPWTRSDIQYHAANIATQMTNNCGFNCLAARVLILHKSWPQGRILLEELRSILAAAPQRKAYYPGAEQQYDRIISANATAEPVGSRAPGVIPYTLVTNLESGDIHNPLFTSECFMPVLAQTHLPGRDAAEFLRNAVEFCNTTLWGTLTACLLIHPETEKSLSQKFDAALDDLHYGTVAINHWGALGFTWGSPIWGAPPGHTPADIQSGLGIVHNTYLFDRPLKSIVHAPFRTWPTPPWFITHRQARPIFTRMVSLEARPNILSALRIAYSAMRG